MPPIGDMAWAASPIASRPGPMPARQTVQLHFQQVQFVGRSAADFAGQVHVREGRWRPRSDPLDAARLDLLPATLGDEEGALPVSAAVDQDDHPPGLDRSRAARRPVRPPCGRRNQNTSIGAPRVSTGSSPRLRTSDERPSAAMTSCRREFPLPSVNRTPTIRPPSSMKLGDGASISSRKSGMLPPRHAGNRGIPIAASSR